MDMRGADPRRSFDPMDFEFNRHPDFGRSRDRDNDRDCQRNRARDRDCGRGLASSREQVHGSDCDRDRDPEPRRRRGRNGESNRGGDIAGRFSDKGRDGREEVLRLKAALAEALAREQWAQQQLQRSTGGDDADMALVPASGGRGRMTGDSAMGRRGCHRGTTPTASHGTSSEHASRGGEWRTASPAASESASLLAELEAQLDEEIAHLEAQGTAIDADEHRDGASVGPFPNDASAPAESSIVKPGVRVELHSLRTEELNGCRGRVSENPDAAARGRVAVLLDGSARQVNVKHTNLRVVPADTNEETDGLEALRMKLQCKKTAEVRKQAAEVGVPVAALEDAEDSSTPKAAYIELIMGVHTARIDPSRQQGDQVSRQEASDEGEVGTTERDNGVGKNVSAGNSRVLGPGSFGGGGGLHRFSSPTRSSNLPMSPSDAHGMHAQSRKRARSTTPPPNGANAGNRVNKDMETPTNTTQAHGLEPSRGSLRQAIRSFAAPTPPRPSPPARHMRLHQQAHALVHDASAEENMLKSRVGVDMERIQRLRQSLQPAPSESSNLPSQRNQDMRSHWQSNDGALVLHSNESGSGRSRASVWWRKMLEHAENLTPDTAARRDGPDVVEFGKKGLEHAVLGKAKSCVEVSSPQKHRGVAVGPRSGRHKVDLELRKQLDNGAGGSVKNAASRPKTSPPARGDSNGGVVGDPRVACDSPSDDGCAQM